MSLSIVESEVVEEMVVDGTARRIVPDFFIALILYADSPLLCVALTGFVGDDDAFGITTVGLELCEARRPCRGGVSGVL